MRRWILLKPRMEEMSGLLKHISTEIFISYPRAKYAGGFTYVETGLQRTEHVGSVSL